MLIEPSSWRVRFRITHDHDPLQTQKSILRWMNRAARKTNQVINEPSLELLTDRDPAQRQTYLYAEAYGYPDTAPAWLRTAKIEDRKELLNVPLGSPRSDR